MRSLKLVIIASITILFSCSGNSPEQTVKDFYSAIKTENYKKAKELSTKDSHSGIEMMREGMISYTGNEKLANVDCITENQKSECDCFFENIEKPVPVIVTKEDGLWKVNGKETLKKIGDNFLKKFEGIDVNGILDAVGKMGDAGTKKINDFLENADKEKIKETLNGLDSNMKKLGEGLDEFVKELEKVKKEE